MTRCCGVLLSLLAASAGCLAAEPPALAISLSVNQAVDATLWPGTPLTLVAVLANETAAEARAQADAAAQVKASLEAAVARGSLTQEDADAQAEVLAAPPAPPVITVAPVAERFDWLLADGQPSPLQPKLLGPGDAVALDGERDLAVTFVVAPDQTQALAPGRLTLRLRYQAANAPDGHWRGIAESEEVTLAVSAPPAAPTAEQQGLHHFALSQYYLAIGDLGQAAAAAEAMLGAVPGSVTAWVQLGQVREAQHDLPAALRAYQSALVAFRKGAPRAEVPLWLGLTVQRLTQAVAPPAEDAVTLDR